MNKDVKVRLQAAGFNSSLGVAIKEKCEQLSGMRERGERPDNCEQEYIKVLQKIEELRSTDQNGMIDQMMLANEYSKFFTREKCIQLVMQCRG